MTKRRWIYLLISVLTIIGLSIALMSILKRISGVEVNILNPIFIAPFLACQLIFIAFKVALWQYAVDVFTSVKVSFKESFYHLGIMSAAKYVPGKIWGSASRILIIANKGASNKQSVLATVIEQVSIFGSGAFLGAFGVINWLQLGWVYHVVTLVVITILLILFAFNLKPIATWLGQSKFKYIKKMEILAEVSPGRFFAFFFVALGQWIFNCLGYVLFALIFFDQFTLNEAILIYFAIPGAALAGFAAVFAPGGIGVREGVLIAMLATPLGSENVIYFVLLMRVWDTIRDILLFLGGLAASPRNNSDTRDLLST